MRIKSCAYNFTYLKIGRVFYKLPSSFTFFENVFLLPYPRTSNAQCNRSRSYHNMTSGLAKAGSGNIAGSHSCSRIASNNLTTCESDHINITFLTQTLCIFLSQFPNRHGLTLPYRRASITEGKWRGKRQRSDYG